MFYPGEIIASLIFPLKLHFSLFRGRFWLANASLSVKDSALAIITNITTINITNFINIINFIFNHNALWQCCKGKWALGFWNFHFPNFNKSCKYQRIFGNRFQWKPTFSDFFPFLQSDRKIENQVKIEIMKSILRV